MADSRQVILITQFFAPEQIGSGPYLFEIAKWFANKNYETEVITNRPYYPYKQVFSEYQKKKLDKENLNNVFIKRVKPFIPKKNNIFERSISDLFFFFQVLFKNRFRSHHQIITLCPSIISVILGNIFKKKKGKHIVVVHDIQSGLAEGLQLGKGFKLILKLIKKVESIALNKADQIVVLTEGMRNSLNEIGVNDQIISLVPIWVDFEVIKPINEIKIDPNLLMYSGNLGSKQGLDQIIHLAMELSKDSRTKDMRIILRGDGNYKSVLESKVKELGLKNIEFKKLADKSLLSFKLSKPIIHLVPQDPNASEFAMPSKIYTLMGIGKTFIATASKNSTLDLFAKESGGFIVVTPNDPVLLKEKILTIINDPKTRKKLEQNGFNYIRENNSKETVLNEYVKLMDNKFS